MTSLATYKRFQLIAQISTKVKKRLLQDAFVKSKAIGKYGQNVNLATQLTQWKIDITSESEQEKQRDRAMQELSRVPQLDEEDIEKLIRHKILNLTELNDAETEDIVSILEIEEDIAMTIIDSAETAIVQMQEDEKQRQQLTQEIEEAE